MRKLKESSAPAPWTDDPILATYRFCNVRRKDDRVSRWIRNTVIAPNPEAPFLPQFLALARHVNWPPTLQRLLDEGHGPACRPHWGKIGRLLDMYMQEPGVKVWTGAYMIRAESNAAQPWASWGKGKYVCEKVLGELLDPHWAQLHRLCGAGLRQPVHAFLVERGYGWGSFMAGQVIDDWSWTPLLAHATDTYTWAPQGPGSVRGMNRLLERAEDAAIDARTWLSTLRHLRQDVVKALGDGAEDVTLHDAQNILCEFSKYEKARLGTGRPRSVYRAETAY